MNPVEYWYSEDGFVRAESELRRAIGQYASRNRHIYLGLTQQRPEDRFAQHQRKQKQGYPWDRMIVIYHARTFTLMQTVEDRLIRYAQQQHAYKLTNDKNSQRPQQVANPNGYWVYILVQR